MLTHERSGSAAQALAARFAEAVTLPADPEWDGARTSFNLALDQSPEAVARPGSSAETAEIVEAANELGLRIAAQGSKHNAGPLGDLEDTVLMRLERMQGVEIDAGGRWARVEAGARWWDVTPRASELGLAALHGSSPEINVVAYSLGGGYGWLVRKHGLQANAITAIELVTADGAQRRVDVDHEPDLFWALRGGGGNFGVVTAIEFDLIRVSDLYAGALFFPFERASEVLHAYREWTAELPEELTSIGRTLQLPDLEVVPEIVRGKSFAIVEAAYLGDEAEGAELLAPLRELGPIMDTFVVTPPAGLADLHMDPVDPVPYASTHCLLGALTERGLDEALAAVGPGAGSPVSFELRHGGGAVARGGPDHGALASLPGEYMLFGVAPIMDPSLAESLEADMGRVAEAFRPDAVGLYLNFTEVPADLEAMFPDGTVSRLRRIRSEYDPDGLFRANHAL